MKKFIDKWEEANKVNTEGLLYIDDGKRKLCYRFTPSKTNPVDAPLLVILHEHGTRRATRFQREGWNVLSPVDHFGYEGKGSWWLGEDGDFFVKDLLQKLIKQIAQKYNSEKNIYIYGSSMGGYGAILHGILCSARAVYANVPQIKLLDTIYSERMMKRYFSAIFSDVIPMENDLENFLTSHKDVARFPIFYLCENVVSGKNAYENYLLEHTDSFVDRCKKYKIKFHLELLPKSGHNKNYGLGEVLDKFERFTPPIEKDKYESIAKVFYPRKKQVQKTDSDLKYVFSFEEGKSLELEIAGVFKFKFLYADEKQLITQKNSSIFQISYDEGLTWAKEKRINNFRLFQIYPLSNSNYLVGGLNSKQESLVYLLDENLNELAKHQLGEATWHSQNAIDEADGIVIFIEYQNVPSPRTISIFRSNDFGMSWKKVFTKPHPDGIRHGHTLQADPYKKDHWLATSGDTPSQSKWFLSKDNGDTWKEVTDTNHINESFPSRSLSAHRTTAIEITEDYYYFATDDLMGKIPEYFINYKGVRKSSSKFSRATKTEPIKIEYLSNLGIHSRSMIDIGEGYIFITEAKYVSFNSQVFYVAKNNLSKVYFLFDIYGSKRHGGTESMNSKLLKNQYFYTPFKRGMFFGAEAQTLKWNITYKDNIDLIDYDIRNYIRFEEHLWFLNNVKSIENISFSDNKVMIWLNNKENVFYMLLGENKGNELSSKELFRLKEGKDFIEIIFFLKRIGKVDITCYVEYYDDFNKVSTESYSVKNGLNQIRLKKNNLAKYIKILFRVFSTTQDEFELSDLSIKFLEESKEIIFDSKIEEKKGNGTMKNSDSKDKEKINRLKFEKDLWVIKDKINPQNIRFQNNRLQMDIDLSRETNASYIESIPLQVEQKVKTVEIDIEVDFNCTNISCFVIEFDSKEERIFSKSYKVKKSKNQFNHTLNNETKIIKILFRFDNDEKDTIVLENLNFKIVTNDIKKSLETYIRNLKDLDKKYALLITFKTDNINLCDSYNFKPRKDIKEFKVSLPVNWDVDPFSDNNWMFQLHALRLLDTEILKYLVNKDLSLLKRIIDVMLDWKRDIIDIKQNFDFDREKNNSSFAWHDMATGTRAPKIAIVFQEIIKLKHTHPLYQYIDEIYELVELHIKALSTQKIAPGNHAIFQIHGLMTLLRLFPDDFENMHVLKKQTEKNMLDIFYEQFFKEGIHKENSANYHSFIFDTFEKILSKEIYANTEELFTILELAKKNCAYMHFPNFESLMTGDSDYKIVKPRKEEEIKEEITHFNESGYTYIYEDHNSPSMLFFDTAFLNRGHRQADFFNILLYEYDKNILVDAGKYSYDKNNPFRQYCVSSRAHNVVLIDNQDYKLDRKYFFTSKLLKKEKKEDYYYLMTSNNYDYFETSHDRHIYYKPQEFLLVVDVLVSRESKNFKQIFHLHQDLEVVEEESFLKTIINDDVMMYTKMKSLDMIKREIHTKTAFSKGVDGEIEGYRALGHNEVVENYVLVNEIESDCVALGSMFSFNKQRDFNLVPMKDNGLEITFDSCQEIVGG